ncbi:helix-turn-helix transcriptional regulator [Paucibacter sp. M5-1]|uniref:helix-turn-helix transcriptional regulator n=1 Tax=Paucibacter sp. M5-1 TaxID=3015998 RepID=UPI0022B89FC7|nr:AraC family transcriptional regulator [Paucibacter sp. M5-1]MCZ7881061.1 AraC family transcriptional regulator [Paucibacter sp. M5-1]
MIREGSASRRPQHWQGGLAIAPACAVWRGVAGDSLLHRHTAAQAVLARQGLAVVEDRHGRRCEAACVLIEPMQWHRLPVGADVTLVFLEPWVPASQVLAQSILPAGFEAALVNALCLSEPATPTQQASFWQLWLVRREPNGADRADGDWLARACHFIEQRLGDGRLALGDLAAHMGLSSEHLRHRFAQASGLPFKRYVLWRRLRLAGQALAAGQGATAAAHRAGFADAAHLARTLKAMFGVTASQIRA